MKWKSLCKEFCRIHLVDKCLIVFMAVLLLQSAYTLLIGEVSAAHSNEIDVIVRTSAASIFGYFLSANFIKRDTKKPELHETSLGKTLEKEESNDSSPEMYDFDYESGYGCGTFQIIVSTIIGLFCLITLILLRDMGGLGADTFSAATVTQFRDFISGCVGFLIGCPTSGKNA